MKMRNTGVVKPKTSKKKASAKKAMPVRSNKGGALRGAERAAVAKTYSSAKKKASKKKAAVRGKAKAKAVGGYRK